MYQKFDILGITASLKDKKVYIECTLDVDETTVSVDTIALINRNSNRILEYDLAVVGTIIELNLKEWPVPNTEYLLVIQGEIKSITDELLQNGLRRKIIFKSEITSTVVITHPSDHEEIGTLKLAWIEKTVNSDTEQVNSYYIEIAKENAFYNIVKNTTVYDKNEISLTDVSDGQYYLRIRAQNSDGYGRWSDITTFLYRTTDVNTSVPSNQVDSDDPIFEQDLMVLTAPASGETPDTFLIEFDEILDTDGVEIIVTRRTL